MVAGKINDKKLLCVRFEPVTFRSPKLFRIQILRPTQKLILKQLLSREQNTSSMDVQTLSMMLNLSNVHANSNILVCESAAGILTGAVMGKSHIYTLGKVPIEILPEKRHITWVLAVLLFTAEYQMEPLAPNAISYDTRPATY